MLPLQLSCLRQCLSLPAVCLAVVAAVRGAGAGPDRELPRPPTGRDCRCLPDKATGGGHSRGGAEAGGAGRAGGTGRAAAGAGGAAAGRRHWRGADAADADADAGGAGRIDLVGTGKALSVFSCSHYSEMVSEALPFLAVCLCLLYGTVFSRASTRIVPSEALPFLAVCLPVLAARQDAVETLVDGRLGLRDNRDVHAALDTALASASRNAVSALGHPDFGRLYGFTATTIRRQYQDESSRPQWADPGQLTREAAFKKLQGELAEVIDEEEAMLAKLAAWKGETAEAERQVRQRETATASATETETDRDRDRETERQRDRGRYRGREKGEREEAKHVGISTVCACVPPSCSNVRF
eukprot:SAG22_NODE_298_length_12785_cov_5.760129_17_plen_355_part_00